MVRPVAAFVLLGLVGCAAPAVPDVPPRDAAPRWSSVAPLLAARCTGCHGADAPAGGLDLTRWEGLMAGSAHGHVVVAFDPAHSLLVRLATQLPPTLPEDVPWKRAMPYEAFRAAHRLPPEDLDRLRAWIAAGARDDAGRVPFEDLGPRAYVAVQEAGMVAVIDVERLVVARHVAFDAYGGTGAAPHDVAAEPDGSAWYVSLIGAQRVLRLDAQTHAVTGELDVRALNPAFRPGMLAVDPASDRIYVSRSISDLSGGRSILFADRRTMTAEEVAVPFTRPHLLGLTPDGRYVLSGSLADNVLVTIDTQTLDFSPPLRVDATPTPLMHADVAPDGRTAAVTGTLADRLYVVDLADPARPRLRGAVPTGREPWYPAFAPDGRRVFVPDHRGHTVTVVDAERLERVATIAHPRFAMPHGAAVTDDGRYVFVTNAHLAHGGEATPSAYRPRYPLDTTGDGRPDNLGTGHVAVIDARTYEVVRILELEAFPSGVAVWPSAGAAGGR